MREGEADHQRVLAEGLGRCWGTLKLRCSAGQLDVGFAMEKPPIAMEPA